MQPDRTITYEWRGGFDNLEVNTLHAEAFETRVYSDSEWNWTRLTNDHSLGWVTARDGKNLVGFVNVLWDGLVHAWIQDVMVASVSRSRGIGRRLVAAAAEGARNARCEWLHVDFDPHLDDFYIKECGFTPTSAELMQLVLWPVTLARVRASQRRHPARTHDEGALARSSRRRTQLGAAMAVLNPSNVAGRGTSRLSIGEGIHPKKLLI